MTKFTKAVQRILDDEAPFATLYANFGGPDEAPGGYHVAVGEVYPGEDDETYVGTFGALIVADLSPDSSTITVTIRSFRDGEEVEPTMVTHSPSVAVSTIHVNST